MRQRATAMYPLLLTCALSAFGQVQQTSKATAVPVRGFPFSATQYKRTSLVLKDGSRTLVEESHDIRVARDMDGRLRLDKAAECCVSRAVVVFDPVANLITPWLIGGRAAHEATQITLTDAQRKHVLMSQQRSSVPITPLGRSESNVPTQQVDDETIEGIPVVHRRSIEAIPSSADPTKTITNTRDEWMSQEMQLVIRVSTRVADKETVMGLEDISRNPDPSLFRPPDYYNVNTNKAGLHVERSIKLLEEIPLR